MIAAVENGLQELSEEDAASVQPRIVGLLSQSRPPVLNMSADEQVAIKQFHDDNSILVLVADKGQSTVIIERREYEKKVHLILRSLVLTRN